MAVQLTYGFELRYLILSRCRGNVQEQAVIRLIEKTISFVELIISKFMTLKSLFESKSQLRIFFLKLQVLEDQIFLTMPNVCDIFSFSKITLYNVIVKYQFTYRQRHKNQ